MHFKQITEVVAISTYRALSVQLVTEKLQEACSQLRC